MTDSRRSWPALLLGAVALLALAVAALALVNADAACDLTRPSHVQVSRDGSSK